MKPTLLVLAAGMGSRYGGLKQLDGFGPNGETIMDYSIYDAINAGFGKVVFVIRHFFEDEFNRVVLSKYKDHIQTAVAFQDLHDLPKGFVVPEGREKPWGTAHAIRAAREVINEPFAMINADDFYGRNSFEVMAKQLQDDTVNYSMVGFKLGNTMSESGSVSRGVCEADNSHNLTSIVEHTSISFDANHKIVATDEAGCNKPLMPDTVVSMNLWGIQPDFFCYVEQQFTEFLSKRGAEMKSEFYIPTAIDDLIKRGEKKVKVLTTDSQWFGVTYPEDRPGVIARLKEMHSTGEYPQKLF